METLTLITGNLVACVMLGIGFYMGRRFAYPPIASEKASFGIPLLRSSSRKEKRKPKSVSEFELWKREQQEAPADPGL